MIALFLLLALLSTAVPIGRKPAMAVGVRVKTFNLHFAAGFKNGHRPSRVKALLGDSWHKSWFALKKAVREAVKDGYVVLVTVDANDRHFPVQRLHKGAVTLMQDGPDYIIAVLPAGYRINAHPALRDHGSVHTFIENIHDCLWVRLRITDPAGKVATGVLAFFNSGRAPSGTNVQRSYDAMFQQLPNDTIQISFVEIGEGDKPTYDEAAMLAATWSSKTWRHLLMRKQKTKEPILLARSVVVFEKAVTDVVAGGVPHQSPDRRLNSVGYVLPYTKGS